MFVVLVGVTEEDNSRIIHIVKGEGIVSPPPLLLPILAALLVVDKHIQALKTEVGPLFISCMAGQRCTLLLLVGTKLQIFIQ